MKSKISEIFIYFLILSNIHVACTQSIHKAAGNIIFKDDFQKDSKNWIVEFEQPVGSTLKIGNGILDINAAKGATVWYKNKLAGNVMITYTATVIDSAGKNDRVSDLNVFWMATNPVSDQIFQQNGKFSSYDNLHLYYAGIGGHNNTTTRFRKYAGSEGKKILKEYTDKQYLLEGNRKYTIKIVVDNGLVQYFINEILFWEFKDAAPYREGYFGFRTTTSHQIFENFKVYKLE